MARLASGFSIARRDDHSSRSRIAPGLKQPTRGSQQLALASLLHTGWASPPLLFGLAPRGVFRAPDVAIRAVGSYPTFSPLPNALRRNRQGCGFPQACRRGANVTGGLIFCGTFRSRRKILRSCQWQLRRAPRDNPLALPGASPYSPTLLRVEDYGSPDFPPACFACAKYTGDHPTHPLIGLYLGRLWFGGWRYRCFGNGGMRRWRKKAQKHKSGDSPQRNGEPRGAVNRQRPAEIIGRVRESCGQNRSRADSQSCEDVAQTNGYKQARNQANTHISDGHRRIEVP